MEKTVHRPGTLVICDRSERAAGFTLVELSIVLVIIGLLVGAIVVGRDMINAAEIRAQIKQLDQYNTAINVFRMRYNYLPGDIPAQNAAQFGFATRAGTAGEGDGNGMIEGGGAGFIDDAAGEAVLFWRDLSDASLLDGKFVGTDCALNGGTCTITSATVTLYNLFPKAKVGGGDYLFAHSTSQGWNSFSIVGDISSFSVHSDGNFYGTPGGGALSPQEALTIDTKLDDGFPAAGKIQTVTVNWAGVAESAGPAGAAATGLCGNTSTATTTYNTSTFTIANTRLCNIDIRMN